MKAYFAILSMLAVITLSACSSAGGGTPSSLGNNINQSAILIDHTKRDITALSATEISEAISGLNVVYKHTSHGSQLITGMGALEEYPGSDLPLQGQLNWYDSGDEPEQVDALRINDLAWQDSDISGGCNDLSTGDSENSSGDTPWVIWTRSYLAAYPETNVVMWSWCSINGHNAQRYVDNMEKLISEFPAVAFVFMTGHAEGQGEDLTENQVHYNNQLIRNHCETNNRILYDFADIEAYDPDGNYYWNQNMHDHLEYGNGNNWAVEWIDANSGSLLYHLTTGNGVDGYDGCRGTAHSPEAGEPVETNLNGVLKGIAAWHLFAEIAGLQ